MLMMLLLSRGSIVLGAPAPAKMIGAPVVYCLSRLYRGASTHGVFAT
jgi:hypothetical protein